MGHKHTLTQFTGDIKAGSTACKVQNMLQIIARLMTRARATTFP